MSNGVTVAVVVPALNEEGTIADTVTALRRALPESRVWVLDNGSEDRTAEYAREAGAIVITDYRRGKGIALRRLLADIDADCYLMVDGDNTYGADSASELVMKVVRDGIDMAIGVRIETNPGTGGYRRGHQFGNTSLTHVFRTLFGLPLKDTLSGYRALSRRFVKSFPSLSEGFEIETELNVHAAILGATVAEIDVPYKSRPLGSESKLNTYSDGARILRRNLRLFRDARPMLAFGILSIPWFLAAISLLVYVFEYYFSTGNVPNLPSLVASVGCFLVGLNLITAGSILERTARSRNETARLAYLAVGLGNCGPQTLPH